MKRDKKINVYHNIQHFAKAATNKTHITGDSCDGAISVLNHCLSWSIFVNTHLYHSRLLSDMHMTVAAHRI